MTRYFTFWLRVFGHLLFLTLLVFGFIYGLFSWEELLKR